MTGDVRAKRFPVLAEGGSGAIGAWAVLSDSLSAEVAVRSGYDYLAIDLQHGLVDLGSTVRILQISEGCGVTPVVRARSHDPYEIMLLLDAGARAVIVPMVDDASLARAAVAAFRYPPHGIRSFGPVRASLVMDTRDPEELSEVSCIAMIETARGLGNVAEIAATAGVDGLYIGPSDLSLSLLGEVTPPGPWLDQPLDAIMAAGADSGVPVGLHCSNGDMASRYLQRGLDFVTVTTDLNLLRAGLVRERDAARQHL